MLQIIFRRKCRLFIFDLNKEVAFSYGSILVEVFSWGSIPLRKHSLEGTSSAWSIFWRDIPGIRPGVFLMNGERLCDYPLDILYFDLHELHS